MRRHPTGMQLTLRRLTLVSSSFSSAGASAAFSTSFVGLASAGTVAASGATALVSSVTDMVDNVRELGRYCGRVFR